MQRRKPDPRSIALNRSIVRSLFNGGASNARADRLEALVSYLLRVPGSRLASRASFW